MKLLTALLALPLCTVAAAQGMYKCKDGAGRITYSGNECHLIGLTSADNVEFFQRDRDGFAKGIVAIDLKDLE